MKSPLQVIVVEDSELDGELIAKSLENEGFHLRLRRVQTARELENALNVQSWDLVISDYSLPQLSGLDALRIVRENADDVPFIMVSGTIGEEVAVQAIRNGADDCLLKDQLGRLGRSVERAIELRRAKARRAEELRESERRFRDLLENVDLIAMTLDTSGRITFCNDYLLRLTGWERAEVVGKDWFHRFIPVGDRVRQVFFDTIRQGAIPAHYENPILTRDGRLRDVQWNNTILRDPKGSVIGVASIGADVTDQKKNEEAKAALALRNESFVKALGEIVYDHDLITDRIEWGGNPERLTGWTAQELGVTQKEWQEKIHHDDAERVQTEFAGVAHESFFTSEYRFRRKDGHYVWVFDRGFIARDNSGRATRVIGIMLDITQRRVAEEQLRSRTALSEALLESSLDGIIVVDDAGKTLLQNRRAIDLWKMPKEIAEDSDDRKRIEFVVNRTKDPHRFIERIQELYARPMETSREEIELLDGTILDRTSAPVHDSSGKYYGRVWTFHDITEQKRAEQRIADELHFNRTILQAAPFGILTYRASGEIISANEAAARLIGAQPQELLGTNFRKLVSWVSTGLLDAADRALTGLREHEIETQFTTSFGKAVWLACRFVPFHYAGEQHLLVMFTDIEERKRSEAALRESQRRFQELAENIEDVFWMTDPQKDRMLYISPAYEKIWGRSIESLYKSPQTWLDAIHPEDRERIRVAAYGRQVDGKYDETYRIVRPDGSIRWVQDRAFPIRDELGRVYRIAGLAEDITARRHLEEQFRQAQKMEAIGTLAGGIAHDFNNILGAISGYTELARMDLNEHPGTLANLDAVSQAAARAAGLVRQILAFSRKQAQERKVIQLRHIVAEALNLLRATIPATITFRSSLPSNTHTVLADATQVHQIVMNLATNAWHAMKDKPGMLQVQLENFVVDSAFADQHPELRPGPYVRLSISDTGHGMDQATMERIFEPFFTTKGPGEGTGLGLSVVHGIMQTHEGAITVESKQGEGTTFRLFFPAHQDETSAGPVASSTIPRGNGQKVLLLDDEQALVSLCKIFLGRLGYSVTAFTKVADAMAAFTANPAAFDLVITDLAMPGMTGTDFAQALMKIHPHVPVIFMTGYSAQLTKERVEAMGLRDLLMKPLTLQTLGNSIHKVLSNPKRI